jgi:hypothetical protein
MSAELIVHEERYSARSLFVLNDIFSDKPSRPTLASMRATGFVPSVEKIGTLHSQQMKGQSATNQPEAYLPDTSLNSERKLGQDLMTSALPEEESARGTLVSVPETFLTSLPSASFEVPILMEMKSRSVCLRVARS